jgi:hypothetical protein
VDRSAAPQRECGVTHEWTSGDPTCRCGRFLIKVDDGVYYIDTEPVLHEDEALRGLEAAVREALDGGWIGNDYVVRTLRAHLLGLDEVRSRG